MSRNQLQYPEQLPGGYFDSSNKLWFHAVSEVCRNMRDDEIRQHVLIAASTDDVSEYRPQVAALGMLNLGGVAFFGVDRKTSDPYVVGGYAPDPYMPGVWQSWMAGTEAGWRDHWRDITRAVRWVQGKLLDGGARRLETNCIASRVDAQRWYTDFLGMKLEGERREYCVNGESLMLYGITREDWNGRWG